MSRKKRTGKIASCKTANTVRVVVGAIKEHPFYHKKIKTNRYFLAHNEANTCQVGDIVEIEECRPISRLKHWRVTKIDGKNIFESKKPSVMAKKTK